MHEIAPVLERPIYAKRQYLNVIIDSASAQVKIEDDKYAIYRVSDIDAVEKIRMLKELDFVKEGEPTTNQRPQNRPLPSPIIVSEYLDTILRWGIAEVELTNDEYVITTVETPNMVEKIKYLEKLGLVKKASQEASA